MGRFHAFFFVSPIVCEISSQLFFIYFLSFTLSYTYLFSLHEQNSVLHAFSKPPHLDTSVGSSLIVGHHIPLTWTSLPLSLSPSLWCTWHNNLILNAHHRAVLYLTSSTSNVTQKNKFNSTLDESFPVSVLSILGHSDGLLHQLPEVTPVLTNSNQTPHKILDTL